MIVDEMSLSASKMIISTEKEKERVGEDKAKSTWLNRVLVALENL
jgi:hypothetical protein